MRGLPGFGVAAGSLTAAIDKGLFRTGGKWSRRLVLRAVLRTVREVAQGMLHMHRSGVVHGGPLTPSNVLLRGSRADRRGFSAKVADYGLSQVGGLRVRGATGMRRRRGGVAAREVRWLVVDLDELVGPQEGL